MFALYKAYHFAPFGSQSLAWMDGNIHHLQNLSFLKDVFADKNQITYTLTHILGGTRLAASSFSLTSPFNLLLYFFEKEDLHSYLDLIVALKLGVSGFAMAYYLIRRFNIAGSVLLVLSLGYALSQYCIAQSSLVFWLDGVYMLPLILLGVYNLLRNEETVLLSVVVGLSLLFNWYTGCINCLFSGIWFCFEYLLMYPEHPLKLFIRKAFVFAASMLIGVLLSACLFLPSIVELFNGATSRVSTSRLGLYFRGNPISAISAYSIGARSTIDRVSLFCGSFALIGCLGVMSDSRFNNREKNIFIIIIAVTLLLFYWQPLYYLFSLLLPADSFWFRYGYVGIFSLIFIAACYYERCSNIPDSKILSSCVLWVIFVLTLEYTHPVGSNKNFYITIIALLTSILFYYLKARVHSCVFRNVLGVLLLVSGVFEMGRNAKELMQIYRTRDVEQYKQYVNAAQKQINDIKNADKTLYRISQNSPRNSAPNGVTAFYNESVAFNYNSISGYTSATDGRHLSFLQSLGYRIEASRITIVNTSLIAADALLGVKYYISAYPINGLEKLHFERANNKYVYLNKFALPMAFVFKPMFFSKEMKALSAGDNPFEYHNFLYSKLLGEQVELYKTIPFRRVIKGRSAEYTLAVSQGNYVLYGNIPWHKTMEAEILYEGKLLTPYSCWLSPSVFYIPLKKQSSANNTIWANLVLNSKHGLYIREGKEAFYALDLDKLKEVTDRLQSGIVSDLTYEKQDLKCITQGKKGQYLYLSIPYHNGWSILRNGEKVKPELFGNCMITLPLVEGKNVIEMHFTVPFLKAGILCSCLSMICLVSIFVLKRRRV